MNNDCWLSPLKNAPKNCVKGYKVLDESMDQNLGLIFVFQFEEEFQVFVERDDLERRKLETFDNKEDALERVNEVAYNLQNA
jgi:hypothetical protein